MQIVVSTSLWALTALVLLSSWHLTRTFRGITIDLAARSASFRVLALCGAVMVVLLGTVVITRGEPVDAGRVTIAANALACGLGCVLIVVLPLLQEHRRRQHNIVQVLNRETPV